MAQYEVDIKIVFTTRNDQNDKSFLPTRHLMALYQEGTNGNFNECLQDWFTKGRSDPQGFLSRHACAKTDDAVDLQIEEMHQWCKANEIQYTSTYFVNGHRLPPAYRLKDLQYFLLT
ncbi:hypothetical protein [Chitinophaga sp.]|uniref:hypothetical protein n=1 Tax=Chitinophaga sp. TaxID=1869181 RepID=UPI0039C87429